MAGARQGQPARVRAPQRGARPRFGLPRCFLSVGEAVGWLGLGRAGGPRAAVGRRMGLGWRLRPSGYPDCCVPSLFLYGGWVGEDTAIRGLGWRLGRLTGISAGGHLAAPWLMTVAGDGPPGAPLTVP